MPVASQAPHWQAAGHRMVSLAVLVSFTTVTAIMMMGTHVPRPKAPRKIHPLDQSVG